MRRVGALAAVLGGLGASTAVPLEIDLPANATETLSRNEALDVYLAPIGVFDDGTLPVQRVEGEVRRSAFRIASGALTPLQLVQPLREQLEGDGYRIVLDCQDAACGGFDFRFATEVLPVPAMQVNLRGFQFVTALSGSDASPDRVVTLLASVSGAAAHLQIIQAGDLGTAPDQFNRSTQPVAAPRAPEPAGAPATGREVDVRTALADQGFAVLGGLDFDSGDVALPTDSSGTLEELARFLQENPEQRIALVGHTDSTGGLDVNTRISRERAEAVRQALVQRHGVAQNRIEAHGIGYLSPRSRNDTAPGRDQNRRVEAILLP